MMTTAASVWSLFPTGTCGHGCEPPIFTDVILVKGCVREKCAVIEMGLKLWNLGKAKRQRREKSTPRIGRKRCSAEAQTAWCSTIHYLANDRVKKRWVQSSLWSLPLTTYPSVGSRGCRSIGFIDMQPSNHVGPHSVSMKTQKGCRRLYLGELSS